MQPVFTRVRRLGATITSLADSGESSLPLEAMGFINSDIVLLSPLPLQRRAPRHICYWDMTTGGRDF
jgi:hypothetical protein